MLRKTEYSESSLIIATLTPDYGQLHFILKGVRKNRNNKFSAIDLFHRLDVEYKPAHRGDLNTPCETECLESYVGIAANTTNFRSAVWLNQFVLRNTKANIPAPKLFQALDIAYSRLASSDEFPQLPLLLSVCFVTLMESGLLPEYSEHEKQHIDYLIEFALDSTAAIPDYPDTVWKSLWSWLERFVRDHTDLVLPTGGVADS